jgi:phage baseplate assembly protein W
MADANLLWGGDLRVGSGGDVALSSGTDLGVQRVLRRLLTNPQSYLWAPQYGAGLPALVGATVDAASVAALILAQMGLESAVAMTPEPRISAQPTADGSLFIQISYADAASGTVQTTQFSIGG